MSFGVPQARLLTKDFAAVSIGQEIALDKNSMATKLGSSLRHLSYSRLNGP